MSIIKLKPLLENLRSAAVNKESVKQLFMSDYKVSAELFMNGIKFYRGHSKLYDKYTIVYPSSGERTSRDSDNIYTVLLSRLPSWDGWPKRSFSLIFTNNNGIAHEYADPDLNAFENDKEVVSVLPDNSANIVVCPEEDIFDKNSFPVLYGQTRCSVNMIGRLLTDIDGMWNTNFDINLINRTKYADYDRLIYKLQTHFPIDKFIETKEKTVLDFFSGRPDRATKVMALIRYFIETKNKHEGNWEVFFDDLLNPMTNGFKLFNIKDAGKIRGAKETWTDSDCLLISHKKK